MKVEKKKAEDAGMEADVGKLLDMELKNIEEFGVIKNCTKKYDSYTYTEIEICRSPFEYLSQKDQALHEKR